ncbi:hypothetical protein KJ657_00400 [Patescibacteria group bacterium]|nr:hypothetical protein [Patescibacteria group bacterium]MBU1015537.1 hypothetical protein [Patescibacteria group bacterium]MBU1685350.1 hypothetical protein [Patescibacteria group bacterium]MBU1938739.1 hypothetical protein [Patescibacteria group bacterium]
MTKLIVFVCVFLACGCAGQQIVPTNTTVPAPPAPASEISVIRRSAEPEAPPSLVFDMRIVGTPTSDWPNMPENCAYTGVVLTLDQKSDPHRVLLENMCIQQTLAGEQLSGGSHLWVEANALGQYPLPFHGVHLEEKKDRLILAFTLDGKRVEEPLAAGRQPGTQSFEHCFEKYFLLPVR